MDTGIKYLLELEYSKNTYQIFGVCTYCCCKLALKFSHSQSGEADLISYTIHDTNKIQINHVL